MNELSLFTGIGGGLLGTHHLLGWHTIGAVEHDEYCCKVLRRRQLDGCLDEFPIWHMDIREFNRRVADQYEGMVDCITAGFPCQPFSVAGKRKGDEDERNMWPATLRAIRIIKPRFALLENVPGLISIGYFGTILNQLAQSGYDCRWCCLGADDVGAPHSRKRLWIVADTSGTGLQIAPCRKLNSVSKEERTLQGRQSSRGAATTWWDVDPADEAWPVVGRVDRLAYRQPNRIQRLKAIGNQQVPAVAAEAWRILTEDISA